MTATIQHVPAEPTPAEARYAFDNGWVEARRRLRLLEEALDPGTTRRLDSLGVAPGWRCLEVGPGGGSIARWLCDRVGAEGRVVAVDLDTRFVEDDPRPNLEIHQRDIVTDGVPGTGYDLIHTRAVLMHLPERERILAELVACLAPGGWLLAEEADHYPFDTAGSDRYVQAWRAVLDALATVGMDATWPRSLPARLGPAGLVDVSAEAEVQYFRGGSTMGEFYQVSWEQARPLVLAAGTPPDLLDDALAEMSDPACWFPGAAFISARGRRP